MHTYLWSQPLLAHEIVICPELVEKIIVISLTVCVFVVVDQAYNKWRDAFIAAVVILCLTTVVAIILGIVLGCVCRKRKRIEKESNREKRDFQVKIENLQHQINEQDALIAKLRCAPPNKTSVDEPAVQSK